MRKSQQLTIETAKKIAEALSAAASTAAAKLPGRQLAHRLPAPPFADGLPKLPKLPATDAVRSAAREYAGQLLAEQRRFAGEVVAEQRRFAGELVSAVSAPRGRRGRRGRADRGVTPRTADRQVRGGAGPLRARRRRAL